MNKTKQKAIIKKLYNELGRRENYIGYMDFSEEYGRFGFISPYRIMLTTENYNEPKAKEKFDIKNLNFDHDNYEFIAGKIEKCDITISELKNWQKDRPYIIEGNNVKCGINAKYLIDAINWCGKNVSIEIDKDSPYKPIWITGDYGIAITMPLRI